MIINSSRRDEVGPPSKIRRIRQPIRPARRLPPLFLADHRRGIRSRSSTRVRYRPDGPTPASASMSTSRRRPDTGRLPSNRFQIFQHNEADCCPKIPLRAPSFSVPSPLPSPPTSFSPLRFLLLRAPLVPHLHLLCYVAPDDRFSIRIIVDPTSTEGGSIESFVFLPFFSSLLSPLRLSFSFPLSFSLSLSVVTLADCSRIILEPRFFDESLIPPGKGGRNALFFDWFSPKFAPDFYLRALFPKRWLKERIVPRSEEKSREREIEFQIVSPHSLIIGITSSFP